MPSRPTDPLMKLAGPSHTLTNVPTIRGGTHQERNLSFTMATLDPKHSSTCIIARRDRSTVPHEPGEGSEDVHRGTSRIGMVMEKFYSYKYRRATFPPFVGFQNQPLDRSPRLPVVLHAFGNQSCKKPKFQISDQRGRRLWNSSRRFLSAGLCKIL